MTTPQAETLIDALNTTFGRHRGCRASHANGLQARGRFLPATPAAKVSVPYLQTEHPVTARFSIGGGKPGISDKSPTVRGIGMRIGTGEGSWALALISAPVFFASSAEQFSAFLAARQPDPDLGGPNPERVKAFNEANPNTLPHQQYLASTAPCQSYTTERYHSGHAYGFDGAQTVVGRLVMEPEQGRHGLSEAEMASTPDDFLANALAASLAARPARWTLKIIVANDADETGDPTEPWHGAHDEIVLGTIEITDLAPEDPHEVFDPVAMPKGVHAPQDSVFGLRSAAYAVSYARRQS